MKEDNKSLFNIAILITVLIVASFIWRYEASKISKFKAKEIVSNEALHIKSGLEKYHHLQGKFCPSLKEMYNNAFIRESKFSILGLTQNIENYTTKESEGSCIVNIPLPTEKEIKSELNENFFFLFKPSFSCKELRLNCNSENYYTFILKNRLN